MDHNKPWKILKEYQTTWQVKKQQLELYMEQQADSKLRKEHVKFVYCHPAYLNFM